MLIKFLTVNFSFCDKVFQFEREEAHIFSLYYNYSYSPLYICYFCRLKNLDSPRNKSLRRLTINGDIVPCRVTALYAVKHSQLSLSVFPSLLFFSTHSYFAFLFYSLSYHPRHFFLLSLGLALCVLSLFFPLSRVLTFSSFYPILLHFCSQLFVFLRCWFSRMACSLLFSNHPLSLSLSSPLEIYRFPLSRPPL